MSKEAGILRAGLHLTHNKSSVIMRSIFGFILLLAVLAIIVPSIAATPIPAENKGSEVRHLFLSGR
jgi:hypothetical protein